MAKSAKSFFTSPHFRLRACFCVVLRVPIRVTYPGSPAFVVYRSGLLIRVLQLSSFTDPGYLSGFSSFRRLPIRVTNPGSPAFVVYRSGLLIRVLQLSSFTDPGY
jgi:hypothetical protein